MLEAALIEQENDFLIGRGPRGLRLRCHLPPTLPLDLNAAPIGAEEYVYTSEKGTV